MAELELRSVTHSFGGPPLLDEASLFVEKGERVCLLGRNGSGKSTVLRLLTGELDPDGGEVGRRPGVRVAGLEQEVPGALAGTVASQLAEALAAAGVSEGWEVEERSERFAKQLGLELGASVADLSAGSKRRVLLARALAAEPDVLVLDEPTNHLDVAAIRSLEEWLAARAGTLVFVTHDRAFLRKLATRIVDVDRGKLRSYECGYDTFLERKAAEMAAEEKANAEFDKKLAQEEAWIRRGILARRTRNMGRVRSLVAMRSERAERRNVQGRAKAEIGDAGRTGQLVIRATKLVQGFESTGGKRLFDGFSLEVGRGDRIGIVGPNGCGKTTLVKLLLGELEPDAGTVKHGTNLEVARFDQLHSTLDDRLTLQENVVHEGDTVFVGGRSRHVMGYLKDFLFTPEQVRGSIAKLSGGERNRLQLAKILARPCNVLVLDEPTNDLDLETIELLEELIAEFDGTLLLVSHDRAFLENVVTSLVVFEDGKVREHVGDWSGWERTREGETKKKPTKPKAQASKPAAPKPKKLTYAEKLELEKLPEKIETLEAQKAEVEAVLADPDFYKKPGEAIAETTAKHEALAAELEEVYERWTALEELASG